MGEREPVSSWLLFSFSSISSICVCRPAGSEAVAHSEPDLPFRIRRVQGEDPHEVSARDVARRIGELERIGDVGGFDPGLDSPCPAQRERTEDREVEILAARAAELIDPRTSKANAFR